MSPFVVALVLNYNRAQDTIACVSSLQRCSYNNLEIIVIDNSSTDTSLQELNNSLVGVEILRTAENLGFAGGNNFAINYAMHKKPAYILLINNDTLVEPDFLSHLVDALEDDFTAGMAGGTICYHPQMDVIWYGGGHFSALRASGFSQHEGELLSQIRSSEKRYVTFVTGCLMLIRAPVFEKVGLFDERFYMYLEDADLSLRFVNAGHRLVFVPCARIYHKIQDRGLTPFVLYYIVRNRLLILTSHFSGWKYVLGISYIVLTFSAKAVFWSLFDRSLAGACFRGFVDFLRGRFGVGNGDLFRTIGT